MSAPAPAEQSSRRLRFERIPMRRIILIILSVSIIYGVVAGSTATLRTEVFTAEDWQSLFINGLARGSVYALIAIGYTLVYGILFMINFAHGEVFMAGVYTAYFVAVAFAGNGFLNSNPLLSIAILLLVSMSVSVFIAVLLIVLSITLADPVIRLIRLELKYLGRQQEIILAAKTEGLDSQLIQDAMADRAHLEAGRLAALITG